MKALVLSLVLLASCSSAHTLTVTGTNTITDDEMVQPGVAVTYTAKPVSVTVAQDPWFGMYATFGVTHTFTLKKVGKNK